MSLRLVTPHDAESGGAAYSGFTRQSCRVITITKGRDIMFKQKNCAVAFGIVALATAVQAQEAAPDTWLDAVKPVLSRAQVQAEAMAQREAAAKVYRPLELTFMEQPLVRTRAEVTAELIESRANGEYARINAEATPFPTAPARVTLHAGTK